MPPEDEQKPAKFVVTLTGNEWGTVRYGIVEYLRKHPKIRAATALTGLLWMGGWVASLAGVKWHFAIAPAISALFVTPTLLWLAVVSGPDFRLTFKESETSSQSAQPASTGISPSTAINPLDPEGYGLEALNKSYVSIEEYGRSSFRWAAFCLIIGIASACGVVWFLFHHPAIASAGYSSTFMWVSVAALFCLSAILFIRSVVAFRRSAVIHDKLLDLQKTLTALRYLEQSHGTESPVDSSLVVARLLAPLEGVRASEITKPAPERLP